MQGTKLEQGKRYDTNRLEFAGFAPDADGYDGTVSCWGWFDFERPLDQRYGIYRGPDVNGVEPLFRTTDA